MERQQELTAFWERYEDLVEVLCYAAQLGPNEKSDQKYKQFRQSFQPLYQGLKPFLISFLEFSQNDEQAGLKLCGRPLDAFEALVAAIDLQEFFKMDDGNMISRINRTREALRLYDEHLRLLASRIA